MGQIFVAFSEHLNFNMQPMLLTFNSQGPNFKFMNRNDSEFILELEFSCHWKLRFVFAAQQT